LISKPAMRDGREERAADSATPANGNCQCCPAWAIPL